MLLTILLSLLLQVRVQAAPVDARYNSILLDHSEQKKIIMVNNGDEDGIDIGDHVKISDQDVMFARGVVIKTSPRRSVLHLYQLIETSKIIKNKNILLKISTAPENFEEQKILKNVPKDNDSKNIPKEITELEIAEDKSKYKRLELTLGRNIAKYSGNIVEDKLMVYSYDLKLETYFNNYSPIICLNRIDEKATDLKVQGFEFGIGIRKYLTSSTHYNKIDPFFYLKGNYYNLESNQSGFLQSASDLSFGLGTGLKYFTYAQWGLLLELEYYRRSGDLFEASFLKANLALGIRF